MNREAKAIGYMFLFDTTLEVVISFTTGKGLSVGVPIPPALWATSGLKTISSKLTFSLHYPRASDPAGVDHPQVYITVFKQIRTSSDSLQESDANLRALFFIFLRLW